MDDLKTLYLELDSDDGAYRVIIDDNGRVAYAYLLDAQQNICADVWLYNRIAAPAKPEWDDPDNAPFANPRTFVCDDASFTLPTFIGDFSAQWISTGEQPIVNIFLNDQLLARLAEGSTPGWSRLAGRDGPLALKMENLC